MVHLRSIPIREPRLLLFCFLLFRKGQFYLMLYSVILFMVICCWLYGYMVTEDQSDSEKENLMPSLHRLLFPISSKGSFICTIPDRTVHTMAFVTPVVEHWSLLHQLWTTGLCYTSCGALAFVTPVMDHWPLSHQLWSTGWNNKQLLVKLAVGREGRGEV